MSSRELLENIRDELSSIVNHSEGIAGWHLNGDIEPWDRTQLPGLLQEIEEELAKPEQEPKLLVDVFMHEGNKCFNTEWLHCPIDWEIGRYFLYAEPQE